MKGVLRTGIVAGAMLALAACGEGGSDQASLDNIDPADARKWLVENGYQEKGAMEGRGITIVSLNRAMIKADERAVKYVLVILKGTKSKDLGNSFAFDIGRCGVGPRDNPTVFEPADCVRYAELFLAAGTPIDFKVDHALWTGTVFSQIDNTLARPSSPKQAEAVKALSEFLETQK